MRGSTPLTTHQGRRIRGLSLWRVAAIIGSLWATLSAVAQAQTAIPKDLEGWQSWAQFGQEFRQCPFLVNGDVNQADSHVCAWPDALILDLNKDGGGFTQRWRVYSESWIPIPGDLEHWPYEVKQNGAAALVVARAGVPQIRVNAGTIELHGQFRWNHLPESLHIPAQSGLVKLTIDAHSIVPNRQSDALLLGKARDAAAPPQMDVQVFRLLSDAIPAELTTRLRLQVGGEGREESLSRALPQGFVWMSLDSPLPAQIDADGRLRVQVRAGSWEINLRARAASVAAKIAIPEAHGAWPKQEIWSFQSDDRLRVSAIEGSEGIDAAQANVPNEWRRFPSFRVVPGASVDVVERSRGLTDAAQDDNRLALQRQLYLDFDHQGYTFIDRVNGQIRSRWRLDMQKPYQLMSADIGGDNLLITEGVTPGASGVEVRTPQLMLTAVGRLDDSGLIPATGWATRFDHVSGILNVPPGYRLLAAPHVDSAPGAWIERWGLLDIFLTLITTVLAYRARGAWFAVAALFAVLLVYQEDHEFVWLLLLTALAMVLLRVAPEGWPRTTAVWIRNLLLAFFLIALVPFAVTQLRFALYPQLADETAPLNEEVVVTGLAAEAGAGARNSVPPVEIAEISAKKDMARDDAGEPVEAGGAALSATDSVAPATPASMPPQFVAPPPAPAVAGMMQSRVASMSMAKSSAQVRRTQMPPRSYAQRYEPSTLLQAGPGRPQWRFRSYPYSWNGPVDVAETLRFIILSPWQVALWRVVGVGLLIYLLVGTLQGGVDLRGDWRRLREWRDALAGRTRGAPVDTAGSVRPSGTGAASAAALLAIWSLVSGSPPAHASSTPDPQLINELRNRLSQPPHCVPNCAEILAAQVGGDTESVQIDLHVSALAAVAVPLPNGGRGMDPAMVSIDGAPTGVYRDSGGAAYVALSPGVHSVVIRGRPIGETLELTFVQVPRQISAKVNGWDVSGITDGRMIANTLEFTRHHQAGAGATERSSQAASFVRVERHLHLDLDWSVTTTVSRLAPARGGFSLTIPLLSGESVLTGGVDTQNGRGVLAGFDSGAGEYVWQSALARSDELSFSAPRDAPWVEVWSFDVSPVWSARFKGLPAVLPQNVDPNNWSFEYYPRPGETLTLGVTRPAAIKGETLAIDSVAVVASVGQRSTSSTLDFQYRSTQGGRQSIRLPEGAGVDQVTQDGAVLPIRPEKNELPLALLPGQHRVSVNWRGDAAVAWRVTGPSLDLRSAASNITTTVRLPADRWILFAGGDGIGPVILYWGELLVFAVLAVLLGRNAQSPLRVYEWLLLGLGLSTFSWTALLLFAAWLFAMRWRREFDSARLNDGLFNTMQVALWILSAIAAFSLIATFQTALLASPDMRIVGAGQSAAQLSWFADRSLSALPQVWVLSVSMWWYKLAMLVWSLWLAFALVRWGRMAWDALGTQGWWRKAGARPAAAVPQPTGGRPADSV